MSTAKLVKVRDPKTLMYLNHEGKFVRDYAPADCIFRLREVDGKISLQHDFEKTYLHACGTLKKTLERDGGLFERFQCPDTFCTYARFSSNAEKSASDRSAPSDISLLVEETDELPLEMMPIGNYQVLSDDEISELEALAKGGSPLGRFGTTASEGSEAMAELIRWVGETPEIEQERKWINGRLPSGADVRICMHGDASITVVQQPKLSQAGNRALEDYKRDNPDEDWSEAIETVIRYKSGGRTLWQNAIFFGENALVGQIIWQAAKIIATLISKGLSKLFTEIAKRGVMRALTTAEARGLQAAMTQGRWYVKMVSWMASGSRAAGLLAGAFNFVLTAVIFFVISYFVFPLIFKKQRCSTYLYNFTNKRLQVSTAYLDNVPDSAQDNSPEAPYILSEVTETGEWITVDDLLPPIQVMNKVVHGVAFDFENDSTFMEGFGALLMVRDSGDPEEKAIYAMVSVPWVANNSIDLSVDNASTNYKSLFNTLDGRRKQENFTLEESRRKAKIGINALSGSDNRYTAQINIKEI